MVLPPALRMKEVEKAAQRGLRRLAEAMQLPCPGPSALRQLQPSHHSAFAILGVPRSQAVQWLRGSGCGGLYLRPFWTERTGSSVAKENFSLLWVRGRLGDGARLWDKIKDQPGVVGLLPGDRDIAIRVTAEARPAELQAQVRFALEDAAATLKQPVAGQRWWRLGPLSDAECFRVRDLILAVGLTPLRDEVRLARAGPFRTFVYFAATGDPVRFSLDDCTWNSSQAQLTAASPPPRRSAPSATARPQQSPALLPAQAQWGGEHAASLHSSPCHSRHSSPPVSNRPKGDTSQPPTPPLLTSLLQNPFRPCLPHLRLGAHPAADRPQPLLATGAGVADAPLRSLIFLHLALPHPVMIDWTRSSPSWRTCGPRMPPC